MFHNNVTLFMVSPISFFVMFLGYWVLLFGALDSALGPNSLSLQLTTVVCALYRGDVA